MATLNGAEFRILTIEWATYQNNIVQNIIGSDTVVVQSQGYKTDPIKIRGMVQNKKELDTFQEQFYSGGALTFIKNINSGEQYQVYALGNIRSEDPSNNENDQGIIFNCLIHLKYPYKESTIITTRSKTITTQNQEWSTDNDGNPLKTEGNVNAVPDIQIIGGTTHIGITQETSDSNYNSSNSLSVVTISYTGTDTWEQISSTASVGETVNCRKSGMAIIDSIQIDVQTVMTGGNVTCTVYTGVGGTVLGSKVLNITTSGLKTFTFTTPIAVIQDENSCSDGTDIDKIYFKLTCAGSTQINLQSGSAGSTDGMMYVNDVIKVPYDVKYLMSGHSCKEIQQTFTVPETQKISKVVLNLCKYQYAGSNPVTVTIKEGETTLGSGTATLTGSTFTNVDFYLNEETAHSLELSSSTSYILVIAPPSDSGNTTDILISTKTTNVYANGAVTLIENGGTSRAQTHDIYFELYFAHSNEDIQVYNIADTTTKCNIANQILEGAIHRINVDGTGTIDFNDDFTTGKYATTNEGMLGITHDEGNDEIDVADDGYIYWKEDTKLPIEGIPTLTSRINITSGIPTIQISIDASTWYDIDTVIVDDVETIYPLDSDGNLSLAGKTLFYWRIDCVKAAAATCSVKNFELDIAIHTIYAKNPKIIKGSSPSTFRIDQDPDSGIGCIVALIYQDRWWI